MKQIERG